EYMVTGEKSKPSEVSRDRLTVVDLASRSTSPDCSAGKRCTVDSGMNSTAVGSSNSAAAMARQNLTSKPCHSPWLSGAEMPGRLPSEPQISRPRSITVDSVEDG